jgi:signal transduction histidine kinase
LINLIDNSVDASDSAAYVLISAAIKNNKIEIIIKDKGAGMDRETLASLFTPFYTTKGEGTGLGMPISRKVIETHNGSVEIKSKQGVGTVVKIWLPYK